ncbi:MAG: DinB family protein [Acidimicrobiales bacterium]|nr:DinB family protein [Acidimicrobiales bacterium]
MVTPDDKDWTWVLERACPECGFDTSTVDVARIGAMVREYACHVRDVLRIYLERLDLMLTEDGPHYPNWDQDTTAVDDRYDIADPAIVAAELTRSAADLAARFDAVRPGQYGRTGFRSDGASFTIDTFARYFIHDPVHHLWDVRQR